MLYQCPDCAKLHDEAWEAGIGLFIRCETCLTESEQCAAVQLTLDFHDLAA